MITTRLLYAIKRVFYTMEIADLGICLSYIRILKNSPRETSMKALSSLFIGAFLLTSLSGCIYIGNKSDDTSWQKEQNQNKHLISQLTLNSDRLSVLRKMGTPEISEAFVVNGEEYKVLYYRTQHRISDGDTTKDETTPLVFKNEKLIGWGELALDTIHH